MHRVAEIADGTTSKNFETSSEGGGEREEQLCFKAQQQKPSGKASNRRPKGKLLKTKPSFLKIPAMSLFPGSQKIRRHQAPESPIARHVTARQRTADPTPHLAPRGHPQMPTRGGPRAGTGVVHQIFVKCTDLARWPGTVKTPSAGSFCDYRLVRVVSD